jgi:hypothetical protein
VLQEAAASDSVVSSQPIVVAPAANQPAESSAGRYWLKGILTVVATVALSTPVLGYYMYRSAVQEFALFVAQRTAF